MNERLRKEEGNNRNEKKERTKQTQKQGRKIDESKK
jgi:hypothetical protein